MSGDIIMTPESLYNRSKLVQVDDSQFEALPEVGILKAIRTDIVDLWHEYQTSASIHGVALTKGPYLYRCRWVLWSVVVVLMATGLVLLLFNHLVDYNEHPIKTSVMVEYVDQIDFPDVTICNMNQFHAQRVPPDLLVRSVIYESSAFSQIVRDHLHPLKASNLNGSERDVSGRDMLNISLYAAHSLQGMFLDCEWRFYDIECEKLFVPVLSTFGLCYTFNRTVLDLYGGSRVSLGSYEGLRLILDTEQDHYYFASTMTAGIKVVVRPPGDTSFPEIEGWTFRPGVSASVALSKEENIGLPPPYKAYGNSSCWDTQSSHFRNPLKRYKYSYQACMNECYYDYLASQCDCTTYKDPGYLNETGSQSAICSARQLLDCYIPAQRQSFAIDFVKLCKCPFRCKSQTYKPTMTYADFSSEFESTIARLTKTTSERSYVRRNLIDLTLYFETLGIMKITQEPEISLSAILGSVGGHMGLCIGASCLSILEILEVAILMCCRCGATLWRRGTTVASQKDGVAPPRNRIRRRLSVLNWSQQEATVYADRQ